MGLFISVIFDYMIRGKDFDFWDLHDELFSLALAARHNKVKIAILIKCFHIDNNHNKKAYT